MNNDFRNYAVKHCGLNGLALDQYIAAANAANITSSYISPTIIEERQLNVAQMDVFSRLMMDRIIFLGTDVNDSGTAPVSRLVRSRQGCLHLYQFTRRFGICRSWYIRHDAVHLIGCSHNLYRHGRIYGCSIACIRRCRKALCAEALPRHDSSADGWCSRSGQRHRNHCPGDTKTKKRTPSSPTTQASSSKR